MSVAAATDTDGPHLWLVVDSAAYVEHQDSKAVGILCRPSTDFQLMSFLAVRRRLTTQLLLQN